MARHSLILGDDWDLHVTAAGGLPVATGPEAIAQDVANAFRLFTHDAWYFPERGIPHFLLELSAHPKINVLRQRLRQAALAVDGVADCEVGLFEVDGERGLNGLAKLTLCSGERVALALMGL